MEPIDEGTDVGAVRPDDQRRSDRKIYEETGGCDFSYVVVHDGEPWRFRVNMLHADGQSRAWSRGKSSGSIPNFEGLYLPPIMEELCKFDQGMVLLAGVTGSGKSTTIASMLNWVNHNMPQTHPDDRGPDRVRLHAPTSA